MRNGEFEGSGERSSEQLHCIGITSARLKGDTQWERLARIRRVRWEVWAFVGIQAAETLIELVCSDQRAVLCKRGKAAEDCRSPRGWREKGRAGPLEASTLVLHRLSVDAGDGVGGGVADVFFGVGEEVGEFWEGILRGGTVSGEGFGGDFEKLGIGGGNVGDEVRDNV